MKYEINEAAEATSDERGMRKVTGKWSKKMKWINEKIVKEIKTREVDQGNGSFQKYEQM